MGLLVSNFFYFSCFACLGAICNLWVRGEEKFKVRTALTIVLGILAVILIKLSGRI